MTQPWAIIAPTCVATPLRMNLLLDPTPLPANRVCLDKCRSPSYRLIHSSGLVGSMTTALDLESLTEWSCLDDDQAGVNPSGPDRLWCRRGTLPRPVHRGGPQVELAGVITRSPTPASRTVARLPGVPAYDSLAELVGAERWRRRPGRGDHHHPAPDAPELVLDALDHGLHVVADKPFAPTRPARRARYRRGGRRPAAGRLPQPTVGLRCRHAAGPAAVRATRRRLALPLHDGSGQPGNPRGRARRRPAAGSGKSSRRPGALAVRSRTDRLRHPGLDRGRCRPHGRRVPAPRCTIAAG